MCCVLFADFCIARSAPQKCKLLPLKVLECLHGPAFNSQYMSIKHPINDQGY